MKFFCLFIGFFLFTAFTCFGLSDSSKQRLLFIDQSAALLNGSGKWRTNNPDYTKTDEWSVESYGYEFEKGIQESTLKLTITGYIPSKSMKVVFWDGFYYWNHQENRLAYISVNFDGIVANGLADSLSVSFLSLLLDITDKKGVVERHKDTQFLHDDQIRSISYTWDHDRWIKKKEMIWKRE